MSQDYKNRIPAYRQNRRRGQLRGALAAAAVLVLAAGAGIYFHFSGGTEGVGAAPPVETAAVAAPLPNPEPKETPAAKRAEKAESGTGDEAVPEQAPEKPRFTFYKILAEKEVVIPEHEIKTTKREESRGKSSQTAYLLQAGAFTKLQDAEKMKARLADIRVKARLEKITQENASWYRVKIGPYATMADADKVRQYLRNHKIDSIIQRKR